MAAKRICHGQFPTDVSPIRSRGAARGERQLVLEVRKTIDFYRATAPVEKLSRVVLSGGAYQAVGLVDLLASEFGAPVDVFDPFRRVARPSRGLAPTWPVRPMPSPSGWPCVKKGTGNDQSQPAGDHRRAAPPREWLPRNQRSTLWGLGMLLLSAAAAGGWWYVLHHQRTALDTRIAASEAELDRLKAASKLVDQLTARKNELTDRLALIDRLRDSKRGPVDLLQTLSSSVPDGLWLLEMKQSSTGVQVDGRAMSLTAVTDFAERMQNSGLFKHPVEILTTSTEVVEETNVVHFTIKAEPNPPATATATPAATPAAPPAAPAPAGSSRSGA
jgi:Tfp pilus assembly protein PilN